MSEQKRKRNDQTGAYILIGLGAILLLVNVFNINLSQLWPLMLVAIGLYMLFGRNNLSSTAHSERFRAPVAGAESADYGLHLSVGEATIAPLANSDELIDADLTYVGDIDFDVAGEAHRTVRLRQAGEPTLAWLNWINPANWFGGIERYHWQIGLNPAIPARLSIHAGVGTADLQLSDFSVTELELQCGAGEVTGTLPQSADGYHAQIQGGLGSVKLNIPANTSVDLDIQGGVGEVVLETDPATALHIESSGGISDVSVPNRARQISGGGGDFELGKTGTWESEDYAEAAHQVTIRYQGGLGELRVR